MRVGEAVITWARVVISCRVNCCRRPVFKKNLVLTSVLSAVVLRPPQIPPPANSIFTTSTSATCRRGFANVPQAPMSPIFDVRCVHRPNSSFWYPFLVPANWYQKPVACHGFRYQFLPVPAAGSKQNMFYFATGNWYETRAVIGPRVTHTNRATAMQFGNQ